MRYYSTSWKCVTTYHVPAPMPACPPVVVSAPYVHNCYGSLRVLTSGVGCQMGKSAVFPTMTISFNPLSTNSCGEPNMYMEPFKCRVTGATSRIPVATAQPPRWCEGNPIACVKGAKQMIKPRVTTSLWRVKTSPADQSRRLTIKSLALLMVSLQCLD